MGPWYTNPATLATIGSFLAAVVTLATAIVISVNSKGDREQQRELAARTTLRPESATKIPERGCEFRIRNDGPGHAWDIEVCWRMPPLGFATDIEEPSGNHVHKHVLLAGESFDVKAQWDRLGNGSVKAVGLDLWWTELEGHRREAHLV